MKQPICVCPGIVKGKIVFFKKNKNYTKNDIVVMGFWVADNVMSAKGAGSFIAEKGSITCHASIVTRELNIPAMINVDISSLSEGMIIEIDTAEETIKIIK
jgi:phosphohistidine swiveling domain-containing protein